MVEIIANLTHRLWRSPLSALRRGGRGRGVRYNPPMIDRTLNYGRHHIERFLRAAAPYQKVLDIGAGFGNDLLTARKVQPSSQLIGVEPYAPYVKELEGKGIKVHSLNIERDRFP